MFSGVSNQYHIWILVKDGFEIFNKCHYKYIAALDLHTEINPNTKSQNDRGRPDKQIDGNIILPLRGFDPMTRGGMRCTKLCDARFDCQK